MGRSVSGMFRSLILAGSVALLTACGGGGGGSGSGVPGGPTPTNEYEIFLTSTKASLPLNLERVWPGLNYSPNGRGAIYTTVLTVQARRKGTNDPIPNGEDVFACTLLSDTELGWLMYLDGDPEHESEQVIGVDENGDDIVETLPNGYRNLALDSAAGAATFHYHASDKVGTETIRCAVTDPQSGVNKSKEIQINIGGTSSGRAAMVQLTRQAENYLYMQGLNGPTQMILQAQILDEAGQPVPDVNNNLCARIVPSATTAAEDAARLLTSVSNAGPGVWVRSSTIDSEARFSLTSGGAIGPITLEVRANRDGNAGDCNAFDVSNVAVIPVVSNNPFDPLVWGDNVESYYYVGDEVIDQVSVNGGTPPYRWSLVSGALPTGLLFAEDAAITGIPTTSGSYTFTLRAEDTAFVNRSQLSKTFTVIVYDPLVINSTALPDAFCTLPNSPVDYTATVQASGGKAPLVVEVDTTTLPPGFTAEGAVISGTPQCAPAAGVVAYNVSVTVTDANERSVSKMLRLNVRTQ